MLKITDLRAEIDGKKSLKGLEPQRECGRDPCDQGMNGAGKSTLGYYRWAGALAMRRLAAAWNLTWAGPAQTRTA